MMGDNAPGWLCITGPGYKQPHSTKDVAKKKNTKSRPCTLVYLDGTRRPFVSISQALISLGRSITPGGVFRERLNKNGFYRFQDGIVLEMAKCESNT